MMQPFLMLAGLALGLVGSGPMMLAAGPKGLDVQPRVIVSVPPLFAAVHEIAGADFEVIAGLPAGRSEHGYEPSAKDVKGLKSASLLVFVDSATDGWMLRLAGNVPRLEVLPAVKPMTYGETTGEVLGSAGRSLISKYDPHFWTDPLRMGMAAMAVAARLHSLKPGTAVERRAIEFNARMQALAQSAAGKTKGWQGKSVILSHASLGYLSKWSGLKVVGLLEPLPHVEPGPRHIHQLVAAAKANSPCRILAEEQLDRKMAAVLATEAGLKARRINPLGRPSQDHSTNGGQSGAYDRYLISLIDEITEGLQ